MLRDFWLLLGEDSAVWSVVGVSRVPGVWRSRESGRVARAHGRERGGATRVALCGQAPALELSSCGLRGGMGRMGERVRCPCAIGGGKDQTPEKCETLIKL